MRRLLKENKLLFTVTLLLSTLVSVAYVFIAVILQRVTDTAVSGDMDGFRSVVTLSVAYLVGLGIVSLIYSLFCKLLVCRVVRQLRSQVFSGILRRNTQDFMSVNTADYLSAVTNDIKLIEDNGVQPLLVIVQNVVMFVTAVTVLFFINVTIGFCLIGCLILMFTIPALFGKALQRRQDMVSKKLSAFTTKVKDILSGYEVIKAYDMDEHVKSNFEEQNGDTTEAKFRADKLIAANESVSEVLAYLSIFSGFFIGAYLILQGSISAGILLALIQLSSSFINPLMLIMDGMPKVQGIRPVLSRLETIIDYRDSAFEGSQLPTFEKSIRLHKVGFSYDEKRPILKDVSLELQKDKKYAVVGPSGSGKSTLIRLLTGTYPGYNGKICFDGQDLRSLDIKKLRGMMSVIHQNTYMFSGSIRENICLHRSFSENEQDTALSVSGVKLFLDGTSDGLESFVGENGNSLSGGQRQRIAVARALIQKTPLLVLDEGTASIDKQTAYSIESSLLNINDLTLITITHDLNPELLGQYDQIIFVKDGEICEMGSLDELLRHEGAFHRFYYLPEEKKRATTQVLAF